jgi:hypothetical protein
MCSDQGAGRGAGQRCREGTDKRDEVDCFCMGSAGLGSRCCEYAYIRAESTITRRFQRLLAVGPLIAILRYYMRSRWRTGVRSICVARQCHGEQVGVYIRRLDSFRKLDETGNANAHASAEPGRLSGRDVECQCTIRLGFGLFDLGFQFGIR